jgi:CheY-like chemotaxis protein
MLHQINADRFPQILYAVSEADPQDLSRAIRSGVNNHILKPFDRHTLTPALNEMAKTVEALA